MRRVSSVPQLEIRLLGRFEVAVDGAIVEERRWLRRRASQLSRRGKAKQQAVTAVARELAGFVWAIAVHLEQGMGVEVMPCGKR